MLKRSARASLVEMLADIAFAICHLSFDSPSRIRHLGFQDEEEEGEEEIKK